MSVGLVNKDVIPEGPSPLVLWKIQMDDPSILENVKMWFSNQRQTRSYYMGDGVEKTDPDTGETYYDFNIDTRRARLLEDDGSLAVQYVGQDDSDRSISTIKESGGTVTCITASDHPYDAADLVEITGTQSYDGIWTITSVPSSDRFQFDITTSPPDENSGDVVEVNKKNDYSVLTPGKRYIVHVSYTSTAITEFRAIAATAKILVRKVGPIQ